MDKREYLEIAKIRLENIEWREWYDNGFVEGLRFNWSNGISTQKYAEGKNHAMKRSDVCKETIMRKIKVDYNKYSIVRIRCFDKHDKLIG